MTIYIDIVQDIYELTRYVYIGQLTEPTVALYVLVTYKAAIVATIVNSTPFYNESKITYEVMHKVMHNLQTTTARAFGVTLLLVLYLLSKRCK